MNDINWITDQYKDAPIADDRIVKRLVKTTNTLAQYPHCTIPQACGCWSETKAVYRILDNDKVTPEVIMEGHRQQTLEQIAKHNIILAIQDTTAIEYATHHNTEGLGLYCNSKNNKGLLLHSTLAVTADGTPLGLLHQKYWTRDPEERGKKQKRFELPVEEKESYKWLEALDHSLKGIGESTKVVTVCDRESDVYDFLRKAISEEKNLLIRAVRDRRTIDKNQTLIDKVESTPCAGQILVSIPRDSRNKMNSREAKLDIKFCAVTIRPPQYRSNDKALENLPLYAVLAKEIDAPAGAKPIYWLLLTTLPVMTLEDATEKIKWYRQRWKIERYHYVLKSGCKVEDLQLESIDRLKNAISIYSIIAFRILWLTYEARKNPDDLCDIVLQEHEWKALYCLVNKTPHPPKKPPTLKEAVLLIARLGGFLARKLDGEPGAEVIWRGMQSLQYASRMWAILNSQSITNDVGNV